MKAKMCNYAPCTKFVDENVSEKLQHRKPCLKITEGATTHWLYEWVIGIVVMEPDKHRAVTTFIHRQLLMDNRSHRLLSFTG